jgi:hypothetical protein
MNDAPGQLRRDVLGLGDAFAQSFAVKGHLTNVFRKLDVESRDGLAEVVPADRRGPQSKVRGGRCEEGSEGRTMVGVGC